MEKHNVNPEFDNQKSDSESERREGKPTRTRTVEKRRHKVPTHEHTEDADCLPPGIPVRLAAMHPFDAISAEAASFSSRDCSDAENDDAFLMKSGCEIIDVNGDAENYDADFSKRDCWTLNVHNESELDSSPKQVSAIPHKEEILPPAYHESSIDDGAVIPPPLVRNTRSNTSFPGAYEVSRSSECGIQTTLVANRRQNSINSLITLTPPGDGHRQEMRMEEELYCALEAHEVLDNAPCHHDNIIVTTGQEVEGPWHQLQWNRLSCIGKVIGICLFIIIALIVGLIVGLLFRPSSSPAAISLEASSLSTNPSSLSNPESAVPTPTIPRTLAPTEVNSVLPSPTSKAPVTLVSHSLVPSEVKNMSIQPSRTASIPTDSPTIEPTDVVSSPVRLTQVPTLTATPAPSIPLPTTSTPEQIACEFLTLSSLTDCRATTHFTNGGIIAGSSIPSELGQLTQLTLLSLANSSLVGSIPSEIGLLSNLTFLNLNNNYLTANLPSSLGLLSKLRHIDLSHNSFTGSIPKELGKLFLLNVLNLAGNSLEGSIPTELNMMKNAMTLNLFDNLLTGTLPSAIGEMTQLQELLLSFNTLIGTIPTHISQLSQLLLLSLSFNSLSGTIPAGIGRLTQLTCLYLNDNRLTGSVPSEISQLTKLECGLPIYNNLLAGSIVDSICSVATPWIDCGQVLCSCCIGGFCFHEGNCTHFDCPVG